jgi:hypothetical protein
MLSAGFFLRSTSDHALHVRLRANVLLITCGGRTSVRHTARKAPANGGRCIGVLATDPYRYASLRWRTATTSTTRFSSSTL